MGVEKLGHRKIIIHSISALFEPGARVSAPRSGGGGGEDDLPMEIGSSVGSRAAGPKVDETAEQEQKGTV